MNTGLQDFALRAICLAAVDLAQDGTKEALRIAAAAKREEAAAQAALQRFDRKIESLSATIIELRVKAAASRSAERLSAILAAVESGTSISRDELKGRSRHREPARARMLAMYLARELTPLSLPQIGRYFGRDHTTVLHAWREIAKAEGDEAWERDRMLMLLRAALAGGGSASG